MHRLVLLPALLLAVVGCNSTSSTSSPGNQSTGLINGTFVATINGTAWTATGRVVVQPSTGSSLIIAATSSTYTVSLTIVGPAAGNSFSLAPQPGMFTSFAILSNTSNTWTTNLSGATGTVHLTTFTGSRVAGTFAFTPLGAQGTPAANVTAGSFDVTY